MCCALKKKINHVEVEGLASATIQKMLPHIEAIKTKETENSPYRVHLRVCIVEQSYILL